MIGYKTEEGTACGLSLLLFYKRKSEIKNTYSSGMPALAQASRVALSQTLACTSPM